MSGPMTSEGRGYPPDSYRNHLLRTCGGNLAFGLYEGVVT